MANLINIESVGTFYVEDITFIAWPKDSYNTSTTNKQQEFDVHINGKNLPITIKSKSSNEDDVKYLLKLHERLIKLWKKQAEIENLNF